MRTLSLGSPVFASLIVCAACSADVTPGGGAGGQGGGGGPGGAAGAGGEGGQGGASCLINDVPMIVSEAGAIPYRLHVPIRLDGVDAALMFDTGSALTFLFLEPSDPAFVPDVATIELGCDSVVVPGRGGLAPFPAIEGLPVVGILGVDYVKAGVTLVDTANDRLVRHPIGDGPPELDAWSALPFDDVQGHMIAPVLLDAQPVRLMFDTGATDTLWLGQEQQPGDTPVESVDAEGTPLTFYYGDVVLEMASEPPTTVPVLRAPSFPYLEQTVAILGGNIHGLLGLSSLVARPFAIDGASDRILLGP